MIEDLALIGRQCSIELSPEPNILVSHFLAWRVSFPPAEPFVCAVGRFFRHVGHFFAPWAFLHMASHCVAWWAFFAWWASHIGSFFLLLHLMLIRFISLLMSVSHTGLFFSLPFKSLFTGLKHPAPAGPGPALGKQTLGFFVEGLWYPGFKLILKN